MVSFMKQILVETLREIVRICVNFLIGDYV